MANENIRKQSKGGVVQTTLSGAILAGATSLVIASTTNWPTGSVPFVITIDPNKADEETLLVTRAGGTTLTVVNRGYDGTAAADHDSGSVVIHSFDANSADQNNRYVNLQTAKGDLVIHDGVNPVRVAPGFAGDASDNDRVLLSDNAQPSGWRFAPLPRVVQSAGAPNVATTKYGIWYDDALDIFRPSDGAAWAQPNNVYYFATVAARAAAIPVPRLGMVCQIGPNVIERYDGDSWRPVGIPIFDSDAARDAYYAAPSTGLYDGALAYTEDNSRLSRYRSSGTDEWISVAPKVSVSDAQPSNPYEGDIWGQPI